MNLRTKSQKGFTIVELLIVIVVIAILAAISIVAYTGIQNNARKSAAASAAASVRDAAEAYNGSNGSYPTTKALMVSGGAQALAKLPTDIDFGTASTTYANASTAVQAITEPKTVYVYPCLTTGLRIYYKDFTASGAAQVQYFDAGNCSTAPIGTITNMQ